MTLDELQGVIVDDLGAVLAVLIIDFPPVVFEARIGVARWPARVLPEEGLVESQPLGQAWIAYVSD